jgi:hypothetical protein
MHVHLLRTSHPQGFFKGSKNSQPTQMLAAYGRYHARTGADRGLIITFLRFVRASAPRPQTALALAKSVLCCASNSSDTNGYALGIPQ